MKDPLKRRIQLAGAAVHAIGDGIDTSLKMEDEEFAIRALDRQLSQARELLRWALETKAE